MEKKFDAWIQIKKQLDQSAAEPPHVNEGDIWWMCLGENVGLEINGKSQLFSRPGIIFKKLSHKQFLIIPTSTKLKEGSWYVLFDHARVKMIACLNQIRIVDYRRVLSRLGVLNSDDKHLIKDRFWELYK